MTKQSKLTPQTDEGWRVSKIGSLCQVKGGGTPSKSNSQYWEGDIPWATVKDLDSSIKSDTVNHITEKGLAESSSNLIPSKSVIISTRMTIGEPFINLKPMAINQDLKGLVLEEDVNPFYLLYNLQDQDNRLKSLGRGTTVSGITTNTLKNFDITLPPKDEQQKIASVLYHVDRAIEKTEDIIEQTRRVKRGVMQDLFTEGYYEHEQFERKRRFEKLPQSWKVKQISDVSEVVGGSTPDTDNPSYWQGSIPWLTPSELSNLQSNTISKTERKLTKEGLENCSATILPAHSILLTSRASIGLCAINKEKMATNQGFQSLIPNQDMDEWYLLYLMRFESPYLNSLGSGSTFSEVSNSMMKKVELPIPSLKEQKKIGKTLRSLDKHIFKLKEKKSRLNRLKKGLMQDLLTGEKRVTEKNISVLTEVKNG